MLQFLIYSIYCIWTDEKEAGKGEFIQSKGGFHVGCLSGGGGGGLLSATEKALFSPMCGSSWVNHISTQDSFFIRN